MLLPFSLPAPLYLAYELTGCYGETRASRDNRETAAAVTVSSGVSRLPSVTLHHLTHASWPPLTSVDGEKAWHTGMSRRHRLYYNMSVMSSPRRRWILIGLLWACHRSAAMSASAGACGMSFAHILRRGVESAFRLLLSCLREVRDTLQISDDTCHIVNVLRVAVWTLLQVSLVYVPALVAYRVGDIECEVVAALNSSDMQQLAVLLLRKMLLEVHVQG